MQRSKTVLLSYAFAALMLALSYFIRHTFDALPELRRKKYEYLMERLRNQMLSEKAINLGSSPLHPPEAVPLRHRLLGLDQNEVITRGIRAFRVWV